MLNSNRTMYCLLLLALVLLVAGANSCDAANPADNNNTVYEEAHSHDTAVMDENSEKDIKHNELNKNTAPTTSKGSEELKDISLEMEDVECEYGEVADLNVVTDPEVDEGVLTWYVNEMLVGTRNLSTSEASFPLMTGSYVPGSYDVLVTYGDSTNYAPNETTATLTINKVDTRLENIQTAFDSENDIDVTLNVVGNDGEVLDYGTLNVYFENNLIESVEVEDYDVSFTLDKIYNMELLSLEYVGDDYYSDVTQDEFVYLDRFDLNMYLPYLNAYQSGTVNESLTFYADRRVNDGVVNVYVDGVLSDSMAVDDGNSVNIIINTTNYASGTYPVYIEYVDSDVYEDAYYQTTLNIKQIATTLYTYNITAHKNDLINLRAGVYNYVDDTDEGMIEFMLDNESLLTTLVTNNTVNETYRLGDNIEYGVHEIKVIYYGSQKYLPSQKTATLNLTRYSSSLSIRNYTLDENGNIALNIRVYSYQKTVDDGNLEVYINGTKAATASVTDNITQVTLPSSYSGDNSYSISIRYNNSSKFDDANMTATITPEKYNTSTRLYTTLTNENILNITSYVYSTNYAQINEGMVKFYLDNTLISTVNVTDNCARLAYDMDGMTEKEYNLRAEYTGTRLYRQSENASSISYQINRKTIYINTQSQIKTLPGQTITVTIRITDYESNTINLSTQATVRINGEEMNHTINEGELTFNYHVKADTPEDTYNMTISIDQTKHYRNATRNIKIIVEKNSPYITSQNIQSTKGETIIINATLKLNNDVLPLNITGIVKINNKTVYQGRFINGVLQYRLKLNEKYTNNQYNITIKSKETTHYHTAQKDITLTLRGRNTYIVSKNIESKNGEKIIINATIYDSQTRKPVKGTGKVCIKINEVTLENININNGRLVYSYVNNYSAKNYTIHIIYGEKGMYNKSEWNGTLTIKQTPLKITAKNINAMAYSSIQISSRILDATKPAIGLVKTVIKIDNVTIAEKNVTNGILEVNYTLTDNITPGKHNLTIIAGDSRRYTSDTTTVELNINRNYKQIKTSDINASGNQTVTIRANIVDINNRPVTENTPVTIKIGGKTIANISTDNGKIEYNYTLPPDMSEGIYEILIRCEQTNGYLHATQNSALYIT